MGAVDTRRNLLNGGALDQRANTQPLKTHEAHIAFNRFALTFKSIHRSLFITVANRNAAEENMRLIRHADKLFDGLMRIRATGRATLAEHAALTEAAASVAPDFAWFALDTSALETEVEATDLDQIDRAGALRLAADRLKDRADNPSLDGETRRTAAAALNRLYGYLREDRA